MATKEVKIIKPTVANANNNLIRMAAYCRVSTDSADQVNSFMAQVAYYSDYIDSHDNMTLVDIYLYRVLKLNGYGSFHII